MIEKNRDILSDAIKKMPVRKPKASNWTGIAAGLDQIGLSAFISKNASGLPAHKAPPGAWGKVAAGLPSSSNTFFSTFWGKFVIGSLIIGGLLSVYLLGFYPEEEKQIPEPELITTQAAPIKNKPEPSIAIEETPTTEETKIENTIPPEPEPAIPAPEPILTQTGNVAEIQNAQVSTTPDQSPIIQKQNINKLSPVVVPGIFVNDSKELIQTEERSFINNYEPVEYVKSHSMEGFKAGFYYAFKSYQDVAPDNISVPKNLSSFGVELEYEKHRWIFKTGLEYLSWKEKGPYTYSYDQNQLIYQYNYVDSTFIDPGSEIVTYFTTENFVYDSVQLQKGGETINNYKLLQIPVIVGYKIFEKGKTSINIIGGVGFDIKLKGQQFIPAFEEEQSSITDVDNGLKYRSNNNWRVLLGFEASYLFIPRMELYAEPGYQWYMNSLYAPENTKGVGLFNIKLGLRYIF